MARRKARPRRRRREADRLSALPDCLLHVIMSYLKARQAVQTCVLSKRWRDLWRTMPCLDVDLNEFRAETVAPAFVPNHGCGGDGGSDSSDSSLETDDEIGGSDPESSDSDHNAASSDDDSSKPSDDSSGFESESSYSDIEDSSSSSDDGRIYGGDKDKEWENFEDFTVNLMHHCNIAQLDSFRLHIGRYRVTPFGLKQVAGWFRRAMKYCTPDPASQRKGLSPSPWRLKRLHLYLVPLDNQFEKHVSSVCRNLEDLELHDCTCKIQSLASDSLKALVLKSCICHDLSEITSPTLKTLVINGGSNTVDRALVILTPALAYLHLAVNVYLFPAAISTNEMPSLVKASIHIRNGGFESNKLAGDQFKLLCSVSTATSLELSGVGKKVLGKEARVQEFMNLRNLLLGNCDLRDDFRILGFFLQSSPNLEKLTLQHCKFPKYPEEKKGKPKLNTISSSEFCGLDFMCENLKVEMVYKDGDAHQLIKLLLCASESLSKNNIKLTKV